MPRTTLLPALVLLLFPALVCASAPPAPARTSTAADASERRAAAAFDDARKTGPLALRAFLERMPKGADLHMHLSGAVYAETFLKDAAEDLLCVDPVRLSFVKNVGTTRSLPPQAVCPEGAVPAASAFKDQHLYDALIDSFSMRAFVPAAGTDGHDQFFATFPRFSGIHKRHLGEWIDEVASRAAAQNEQYLEIMETPSFVEGARLSEQMGWPAPLKPATTADGSVAPEDAGTTPAALAAMRDKLLAGGLRNDVATGQAEFAEALAQRNRLEHCGEANALPACSVQVRFLYQVLRGLPPQQVFARTLLGFELAASDPDVVGLNFVMPEDGYLAMTEYHRQMLMLSYLHSVYPQVHIALHAGELAPSLVPPAGLRFHIREAVDLGHAERIGHGVDVMYETDPNLLLRELAARHVMVEINLTSNDVILGVASNRHSLPFYRAAHVPVALSTDDEGVSRIDLTHEYTRAALDFGLGYLDLKSMARTSLEHSFLPGPDLWQAPDTFLHVVAVCAHDIPGADQPSAACVDFLRSSPRAAQQWQLEHRFSVFQSTLP